MPLLSKDENARLALLHLCNILDLPEDEFNDFAQLAAQVCETPAAYVNFVDAEHIWIKGKTGIDVNFTSRADSFCSQTILQNQLMIVRDAQNDSRFTNNSIAASNPHIRFYAGTPLITSEGYAVGTICVMDSNPRELSAAQKNALSLLSRQISAQIDLRLKAAKIERDIEAKRQTAFAKAAYEWRMTFDALENPILLLTADGKIARLNRSARELFGQSYDDIIGSRINDISLRSPWNLVSNILRDVVVVNSVDLSQQVCDEDNNTWHISIKPYIQSEDNEIFMVVVLQDVTERISLEESLRRSETMSAMGNLLAGVAHEVRNPLFSISATLDAFEARFGIKKEYEAYISTLRAEIKRMTGLMQELLDYGKSPNLELRQVSFNEVITEAIRSCEFLAESAKVKVCDKTADKRLVITADRFRLSQVFQNLIENAIQHSPENETVSVEAGLKEHNGNWLECTVKDNGQGFRLEEIEKIFEPFFTRRHGGTGLGLSIVQRIIEEHGGKITADNRKEGGAVMTVLLPVKYERNRIK